MGEVVQLRPHPLMGKVEELERHLEHIAQKYEAEAREHEQTRRELAMARVRIEMLEERG